ncbi:MAG: TIM-barrel domain-containing protein [Alkalispirochaeta sp.]
MQHRQSSWFSFGEIRGSDAGFAALSFRFTTGAASFARSSDHWLRLSLRLDSAVTGEEDLTGPGQIRSWAVDPAGLAGRHWHRADVDEPIGAVDHRSIRHAAGHGGVEGNINPHEDTRGIVPVEVRGHRFSLPLAGSSLDTLELARSRDGVLVSLPLDPDVRVYGLGEKTGSLDKRGRTWTMWNSDEPDHTPERDPLYQSIPVAYLFTPEGTSTLFVDSTATVHFDVGEGDPGRLQIEIHDTSFDIYLRHDSSLPEAVEAYTGLTGRHELPPEWALGFQQCRYSYFPERRVLDVAGALRREEIPADVLYLDIHYMDGYRVFTWDRRRFPDPAAMIARLREQGFRLVTIVDPGVKTDTEYPVFAEGAAGDLFLDEPTGIPYVGQVWPGDAVFPDFTDPRTRSWWAQRHTALFDEGVAGIWNDMNEPADFTGDDVYRPDFTVPDRLVAQNDGYPASMARLHNAYGNAMNEATREAFRTHRPNERGFVLTRAGYAGVQRNAAVWTGDNHSWWEHIGLMTPMLANLGLSGVAFAGGDVGGFQLNASGELYARWIAAAALTPFFRAHSALDTQDHEPWSFGGEVLAVARRYVGLRYRLMPYLYTLFEEASRRGSPVVRPLVWEFPRDPRVANRADSFMVGSSLLVAPVGTPGVQERSVYLPAGTWYDFWTGDRIEAGDPGRPEAGGVVVACDAPVDRLPIFVRGGSVIPFESLRQHTGEAGDGILRLLVAPDADGSAEGQIYADAGEGFEYRHGAYWRADCSAARAGADGSGDVTISVVAGSGYREIRWDHVQAFSVNGHIPPAATIGLIDGASGAPHTPPSDALPLVPEGTMVVPTGA